MNKRSLSGNIVVIALVAGIVLIIAVLGVVLWRQFLQPATTPVENTEQETITQEPVESLFEVAADETLGSGFAVEYPKVWTRTRTGSDNPQSNAAQTDQTVLTSPSGAIQVKLTVKTHFAIGTGCTNDYIKLKYLLADETPQFTNGRFAAYVVYFPRTNFYQYHAGLQNNTEAIRGVTLTSNTACNFFYGEFIRRESSLAGVPTTYTLLNIVFPDLYSGDNLRSGVDETDISAKLNGEEYEQAKAIVQSVYIK